MGVSESFQELEEIPVTIVGGLDVHRILVAIGVDVEHHNPASAQSCGSDHQTLLLTSGQCQWVLVAELLQPEVSQQGRGVALRGRRGPDSRWPARP